MNDLFSSVDVEKLLDPLASDFKLIPDAIMNSLGRLVAAMDHCGNRSFLEVYSSKRSSSFASTINEQFHILEESLEQKNESAK